MLELGKHYAIDMHAGLSRRYIELQALMLVPIAPHWAEYIWRDVLGASSDAQTQLFHTVPDTAQASLTAMFHEHRERPAESSSQRQGHCIRPETGLAVGVPLSVQAMAGEFGKTEWQDRREDEHVVSQWTQAACSKGNWFLTSRRRWAGC